MLYSYKQLRNGRYGIFANDRLIASIGCLDTCKKIVYFLEMRRSNQDISGLEIRNTIVSYFHDMKLRP